MPDHRVYRGGKVHVVAEKCGTCVFRPGNKMSLMDGRLAEILKDNLDADAALQCHKTLDYAPDPKPGAICRGFFDVYNEQVTGLRLAGFMGVLEFDV